MIDIIIKIIQMKIVTNVVAGVIIFVVVKKFFDWQNERRMLRVTERANQKIFSLLKPYITAGQFASPETFHAILTTVARDYHITPDDLYSVKYYCQEFIKEILENEYILQEKKVEYADLLKEQIVSYETEPSLWIPRSDEDSAYEQKKLKSRFDHQLNICTFFSSGIIMVVNLASGTNDLYESLAIFAVVLCVLIVISDFLIKRGHYRDIPRFLTYLKNRREHRKQQREEKRADIEARQEAREAKQDSAERRQLTTENEKLINECDLLRRELAMTKELLEPSGTEPAAEPPTGQSAETEPHQSISFAEAITRVMDIPTEV